MDDTKTLWKSILAEIEMSVSKATYKTHFAGSELVSYQEGVATIGFANPLIRTMVETRYHSLVKSVFDAHAKSSISLIFVLIQKRETIPTEAAGPLFQQPQSQPEADRASIAKRLHLRPEYTFESFAVSTSNQMAHAAASAVAKSPGSAYNPLFLYGGVGVGKTHLMHAVANELLKRRPNMRIVYCMGDEFLNDIVEAIQTKTNRQFKQKYRSSQLLLVDDVQFIAGKQTAQEEFFHTFNEVHREGGQIILTSDRPPSEIARLEDRLRSRFEGGMTIDVAPPDFELRAAIVNIKAERLGVHLPGDVTRLVAANITDTRAIEGFLRRLATEVATKKTLLVPEAVAPLLGNKKGKNGASNDTKKRVEPREILDVVSAYYNIKSTAIKGPRRNRPIARPRQVVMYLCKTELGLTLDDIGGLLGGRDHTTILHGVETVTKELSTNERLRGDLVGIKQKLWG